MEDNRIDINMPFVEQAEITPQQLETDDDWMPSFRLLSQEDLMNTGETSSTIIEQGSDQMGENEETISEIDLKKSLVGQRAKTWEELFELYRKHANELGFSVKKSTIRKSAKDGRVMERYFCWSCEGKSQTKVVDIDSPPHVEVNEYVHPSPLQTSEVPKQKSRKRRVAVTRTGCTALMRVKLSRDEDLYVVERHETEHNHMMIRPEWSHLKRSERSISEAKGKVIQELDESGIRPVDGFNLLAREAGGEEYVGHTIKDHLNFCNRLRMERIESGDAQTVVDRLNDLARQDPNFYYKIRFDDELRLCAIFWRDGMMRDDFELYGDVVIFDTTYNTNRYNLICAPIVGVNNHWNTTMFGCAFIADESTETFEWLLKEFKKSMGGKVPKTIFTDQDLAMSKAIEKVFGNETKHRLCLWHIQQNAVSRFGILKSDEVFKKAFIKCLMNCNDITEFEKCWESMINTYNLQNNDWFSRLYSLRQKWSTAYSKDFFFAGILSSQRSESTNNAISFKASNTTSLVQFFDIFNRLVNRWRRTEQKREYSSHHSSLEPTVKCGILRHASEIYTLEIYKYFEAEVESAFEAWFEVGLCIDENNKVFHVTHESGYARNPSNYKIVHFRKTEQGVRVDCSCKQYSVLGWLCYHAIKVLNVCNIFRIPDQYINQRWTKMVKASVWNKHRGQTETSNEKSDYLPWRQHLARKFYDLMMASEEDDSARRRMEEGYNKLSNEIYEILSKKQSHNVPTTSETTQDSSQSAPAILDPTRANTKGRKKNAKTKFQRKKPVGNEFGSKTPNPHLL